MALTPPAEAACSPFNTCCWPSNTPNKQGGWGKDSCYRKVMIETETNNISAWLFFFFLCFHNHHLIWSSYNSVKTAEERWSSSLYKKAEALGYFLLSSWSQSWCTAPVGLESPQGCPNSHRLQKQRTGWMAQKYPSISCKSLFSQLPIPCSFPPTMTFPSI